MTVRQDIEKGFPVWFIKNGMDDSLPRRELWEQLNNWLDDKSEMEQYLFDNCSQSTRSGKLLMTNIIKNIKKILTADNGELQLCMAMDGVSTANRLELATHAKRYNGDITLVHHEQHIGTYPILSERGGEIESNVDEWLVITTYNDGSVLLKKPIEWVNLYSVLNLNDMKLVDDHLEQADKAIKTNPSQDIILYQGDKLIGFYQQTLEDEAWPHVYKVVTSGWSFHEKVSPDKGGSTMVQGEIYFKERRYQVFGSADGQFTYDNNKDVKFLADYITEHVPEKWNWETDLIAYDSFLMVRMIWDEIIDWNNFYFVTDHKRTSLHLSVLTDDEDELNQLRLDYERGLAHMIARTAKYHPTQISTIRRKAIWLLMFAMNDIHPVDMYHLKMKEVYRKIIRLQNDDVRNLVMDNAREMAFKITPQTKAKSEWEQLVMDMVPVDMEKIMNVDIEQEIVSVAAWDLAEHNHFDNTRLAEKTEQIVRRQINDTLRDSKSPEHTHHWYSLKADEQRILIRATQSRAKMIRKTDNRPDYLEQKAKVAGDG